MNNDALNKIYNNLNSLIGEYNDFPETKDADDAFWKYIKEHAMEDAKFNMIDFQSVLYDVMNHHQRQGFIMGFKYACRLLVF